MTTPRRLGIALTSETHDSRGPGMGVAPPLESLLRLADVARHLGVSRRTFERELAAGRFPAADLRIRRTPLWRPRTVLGWIEDQSSGSGRHGRGADR
jgi:hypothetical protein